MKITNYYEVIYFRYTKGTLKEVFHSGDILLQRNISEIGNWRYIDCDRKESVTMFNFGHANDAQKQAIETTDGPVLITAGPGTGKTFTLVQRTIYLIQEKGVRPEEIMLATFTEKAAKELITRITNELVERGIVANINDMYIGTFHSICLRIIKEHLEYTRLKKNFRTLDQFDQIYTVFQNINKFREIQHFNNVVSSLGAWNQACEICSYVNKLSEELVDPAELIADCDISIAALGRIINAYQEVLTENNLLDFSAIQVETYKLLTNSSKVLGELQEKIRYIMIDEYQDTNYIQEQLVFLFGGEKQNICVVGDDDQGLYRFRGATVRNILEFPEKFSDRRCKIIPLVINYRSNSDIVDFYNKWMATPNGSQVPFSWGKYRYDKTIEAHEKSSLKSPAVVKLASLIDEYDWQEKILFFIEDLMHSGKVSDYNQIAFLFSSVKHQRVLDLARFLERSGISVYSPRSNMFFQRREIRLMLGCLMLMFPQYIQGLDNREYKYLHPEHYRYYHGCIEDANDYLSKPESTNFRNWIHQRGKTHSDLRKATDYGYLGLLYQMFEFSPFSDILSNDLSTEHVNLRAVRNIALFTQVINKYEYLHRIDVLTPAVYQGKRSVDTNTEVLFNVYLRLLYDVGISEYEDDAEYAPSGCVSFLTIHQSKGMEFPIVIVDSLDNKPRKDATDLMMKIEIKHFKRQVFEPHGDMKFFDFWRLYYTAFSRAQNLLVLTCIEDRKTPSKYLREGYSELADIESNEFDINEFTFNTVKKINLKEIFSFTSHISVYETCAVQYKLYKELQFMPVRVSALLFGKLVHQTIEDIHKAVLQHKEDTITVDNITHWFDANYTSLSNSERAYLAVPQRKAALKQVLRYAERHDGTRDIIREAEVDVSLVKPDYIIEGKIDLIKGEGDTVELVDFKSEKKPDLLRDHERIEHYHRQLQVYAYLVEEKTGRRVSKMNLYFTGEESDAPIISFPYQKAEVDATIQEFDDAVHKILRKEFNYTAKSSKVCDECDFRFLCGK